MDKHSIIQTSIFFILWKKTQSNQEGGINILEKKYNRNFSLIFPINNEKNVHFHHWIYLLVVAKKYKKKRLIRNICIAGIIQGLMYKDCFNIIGNKKNDKLFFKKFPQT